MKDKDKDILAENLGLRKMPFSVPEGYFETFKDSVRPYEKCEVIPFRNRIRPYLALAAMFVLLVTAGTLFLRNTTDSDEFSQEDFLVFSGNLINTEYYEEFDQLAVADIADEDIIEYLIYSGISAEEIELSK